MRTAIFTGLSMVARGVGFSPMPDFVIYWMVLLIVFFMMDVVELIKYIERK